MHPAPLTYRLNTLFAIAVLLPMEKTRSIAPYYIMCMYIFILINDRKYEDIDVEYVLYTSISTIVCA